jgi:NADPH:quinone reductase-like Zn-dependent oxidoreductase
MKAAVLHEVGKAPRYREFAEPTPEEKEALVTMRAASLKNIDRMMADGSHYDAQQELPAVAGVDGVGVLEDGTRVYCGGCRSPTERWRRGPSRLAPSACRCQRASTT